MKDKTRQALKEIGWGVFWTLLIPSLILGIAFGSYFFHLQSTGFWIIFFLPAGYGFYYLYRHTKDRTPEERKARTLKINRITIPPLALLVTFTLGSPIESESETEWSFHNHRHVARSMMKIRESVQSYLTSRNQLPASLDELVFSSPYKNGMRSTFGKVIVPVEPCEIHPTEKGFEITFSLWCDQFMRQYVVDSAGKRMIRDTPIVENSFGTPLEFEDELPLSLK